jgi:hypothetical protein
MGFIRPSSRAGDRSTSFPGGLYRNITLIHPFAVPWHPSRTPLWHAKTLENESRAIVQKLLIKSFSYDTVCMTTRSLHRLSGYTQASAAARRQRRSLARGLSTVRRRQAPSLDSELTNCWGPGSGGGSGNCGKCANPSAASAKSRCETCVTVRSPICSVPVFLRHKWVCRKAGNGRKAPALEFGIATSPTQGRTITTPTGYVTRWSCSTRPSLVWSASA